MRTSLSARLLHRTIVTVLVLLGLLATAEAQMFPFFGGQPRRPLYQPRQLPPQQQFFNPFAPTIPQERPADYSRAPAPRKSEITPTTKIVVMGDSLADWLAYGLEDAFADVPEIGVVRKHRTFSGLLRYDSRPDSSWAQVVRETITAERPDFVVMMLGINDRASIRERQAATTTPATPRRPGAAEQTTSEQATPEQPDQDANEQQSADLFADDEQPAVAAPEPPPQRRASSTTLEFRSDRWAATYNKRIEETIAALKSASVPVIWVGLPALRGTRSTSDMIYLNGLYRAAAAKANIVYADVWDGFVDEAGKFSVQGPDVDGQIRRLRTADGVHFTRFGARKLAHFVEREIQRLMASRAVPVALPAPETAPQPAVPARPGVPAQRPLAGPVLPLTVMTGGDELLGATAARPANNDPLAAAVLIRGEAMTPLPGRADDFTWPRPTNVNFDTAPGATPVAPPPAPPLAVPAGPRRSPTSESSTPPAGASAVRNGQSGPRAPQASDRNTPRPPAPVGSVRGGGLFGIFR